MMFATLLLALPIAQFPQQPQFPQRPQQPMQQPQMPKVDFQINTSAELHKAADSMMATAMWMGVVLAVILLPVIVGMWVLYEKANEPGWACLVPIYNVIVLARMGGKPEIWGLLCLIPLAGIFFYIMIWIDVCNKFGRGAGYVVGVLLLPFVFVPMLAFGGAVYEDNAYRGRGRSRARRDADRPRKRRVRVEEDEEDRPRKRRVRVEEDEEDRPRKRRPVAEEDEEEDRPRKRRPVADDADEEPRPRRSDPRVRKRDDRYRD